ncbi:pyridoxal-phosphate dependent enzyme [Microbacterium betulae]|uniref:Pyridoxal-phosphate dependent enzyme n=1 Tax=Microbacterium betulae TaxID=2981139 RepID=A0AA97I701_9MICO|nr:pyridoxal-phosphate dependent enzyme [Microbacterium sp. AB]WOF23162.1 pyridoxal-phosphate dependent enzyme [Microbacterium sp. AB]
MTALPPAFPDPSLARVYGDAFELVGNTPLVRVNRIAAGLPAEVYVKLDQHNLGGSSKDRIGINIVREAIASGDLKPGDRIIDFGAGNTAIGYALAGIATGHPVTAVAAPTLSPAKASLLRLLGADIVPGRPDVPKDDPEHWGVIAARYENEDPGTWWARQESNDTNPAAHALSTGPEIWEQTDGRVTHFVAALATGGTATGTGRYLKGRNPEVTVIGTAFDDTPVGRGENNLARAVAGEDGLEEDWSPNIDVQVLDRLELREKAEIIAFGWHVARTEGLVLGPSSILSLQVALELAAQAPEGSVVVSFSADSGRDYLQREYDPAWLRENELGHVADRVAPVGEPV